ncbi:MAG: hypothetical protein U1E27_02150, partial [Kiritimatiellia bacterium]|nr:hypothetical protein [Kiritimatiellia bacterium]
IPESSAGFTVDYVITNAGSESVHTGFWIKNNPAYLDKRMYENVDLVIGGKTIAYENIQGSVNRFRPEGVSIASGVEAVLQRVFKNRTPERVPGTRLKLTAEGRSLGMEPDAEKVYEYMTWSTARMDHITLELLLKPVLLAPGDRWMFQINYSFDR